MSKFPQKKMHPLNEKISPRKFTRENTRPKSQVKFFTHLG
eukprot:UN10250